MVKREFITKEQIKHKFPIMENDFGMVINETLHKELDKIPTVEAIPKAEYEARLKADMVAMLRFLWNDIENLDAPICDYASSDCISKWQVHEIIQQKIDALKEIEPQKSEDNNAEVK